MGFAFCSFSSGSDGNCYLIKSERAAILIDAGIGGRRIWEGLEHTDTDPSALRALLLTHEHSDHIKGLGSLMRKSGGFAVYANKSTWDAIGVKAKATVGAWIRHFTTGESFAVGDIVIKTFAVSHDAAEPVGYTLRCGDRQIGVVTDTGRVDDGLFAELLDADTLVLESNHDVDMLRHGKYPWFLKRRILGDGGHLSNVAAAELILRLLRAGRRKRRVLLAHISRENNVPEMAIRTVERLLEAHGYAVGTDLCLDAIPRNAIGAFCEI
ncbi:MAG: MBL fold metallo-hydrolase [Clostridiales Family XIII bacterium]|jgi:phosphoribosyl 1,2-cyclic phosphodiesterase|nr:MBL fold metallo-hydrolase [Clostridiales Family XIII bacterium]